MTGVNKFSGEFQGIIHHVFVSEEKRSTIAKEKVVPSQKVTPSEEVEKGTYFLNDIEDPVITILKNDLDNFQGQSTTSTGWFNLYHKWLERNVSSLEPDFYKTF